MLPFERLKKSNTIENLWLYILALAKKGEIYGYNFQEKIKERFGFKPGKITAYRVLYRLESQGFVKSKVEQRRRVYKITKKGIEELEKAKNFFLELAKKID